MKNTIKSISIMCLVSIALISFSALGQTQSNGVINQKSLPAPIKSSIDKKILTFVLSTRCPYICEGEEDKQGFLIDIVSEIFEKENYKVKFISNPWKRALQKVKFNEANGIIGILKRSAPELIFPIKEIGVVQYQFLGRSEKPWRYKGLRSLFVQSIGVTAGESYGIMDSYIKRYSKNKNKNKILLIHGRDRLNRKIKLLRENRITTFMENKVVLDYFLNEHKSALDNSIVKEIESMHVAGEIPQDRLYIAFSPEDTNSEKYASIVSKGMDRLRLSGRLEAILAKYGLHDWNNEKPKLALANASNKPNSVVIPNPIRSKDNLSNKIRFIGSTAKDTSAYWKYAAKFKEVLEELSNNKLEVELDFGVRTEHDIVMDLAEDQVEMGIIATNNLTPFAPSLEVMTFPYLFPTLASMKKLILHTYMKEIENSTALESGVRPISWYLGGYRFLANNVRAVKSTEDMQGLKIRVPRNQVMVETFRAWGLETYPLSWPSVYPSLDSNLIQGMENPLGIIFSGVNTSRPVWESLTQITKIHYFVFTAPHMVSESFFKSLSIGDQILVRKSAKIAQDYIWKLAVKEDEELEEFAKQKGMIFTNPVNEESDWRAKAIAIWPKFYSQVGGREVIEKVESIIK